MTMTRKEMYEMIMEYVTNLEKFENDGSKESLVTNIVDFCNHEIELLERKSTRKVPTKKQVANDEMKKKIINILSTIVIYVVNGIKFFSYNKRNHMPNTRHSSITTRYTSKIILL